MVLLFDSSSDESAVVRLGGELGVYERLNNTEVADCVDCVRLSSQRLSVGGGRIPS